MFADGQADHAVIREEMGAMLQAVKSGRMPKDGGALPAAEVKTLEAWHAAGGPDN